MTAGQVQYRPEQGIGHCGVVIKYKKQRHVPINKSGIRTSRSGQQMIKMSVTRVQA